MELPNLYTMICFNMTLLFRSIFLIVSISFSNLTFSQVPYKNNVFAKEWNQDFTIEMAKLYLVKNILSIGDSEEYLIIDGIGASNSGELTSICYSGDSAKSVGVLFTFYGNYWNDQGVQYKGYGFKNMQTFAALEFLNKIITVSDKYQKFMDKNFDVNNIVFTYDDIVVVMFTNGPIKIRLFWEDFDAEWTVVDAKKTLQRFEKFIGEE